MLRRLVRVSYFLSLQWAQRSRWSDRVEVRTALSEMFSGECPYAPGDAVEHDGSQWVVSRVDAAMPGRPCQVSCTRESSPKLFDDLRQRVRHG